ncbi:squalene/phytoene synthase family protein [Kitasatospora sp. NPDC056531]|uniref:squalene/phytoene synthase family protein n=1 Tax=Kitasatospora sp. NPDC056531 TaxID=3345856 RepID=UPI00369211EF
MRAAYRLCRRRTREEDPEAYALVPLMPAALCPALWALWATVPAVDDLADDRTVAAVERARRVEEWIAALEADMAAGTSTDPIRHALVDTAARWHLDLSDLKAELLVNPVMTSTAGTSRTGQSGEPGAATDAVEPTGA